MKKLFMIMMVAALIMGFGTSAYAGYSTQVTLTSPAIVKTGCEKVGAVTYSLAAGSILTEGDWWYYDLPAGTSICNPVDYFIVSGATAGAATNFVTLPSLAGGADATDVDLAVVTTIDTAVAPGVPDGPLSITDVGLIPPATGVLTPALGGVVLRVVAAANSQRVWVYVYGTGAGSPGANASVTVAASTSFEITLLNGQPYKTNILLNTDTILTTPTVWGDEAVDTIDDPGTATVPHIENTLCVNAELMSGSLMFVSFASLNDFLTFTGDSQIAHVVSVSPLSLAFCKGDTAGNIEIAAQGGCTFVFESTNLPNVAPVGYCPGTGNAPPGTATFLGNRMFIQSASTFGDPGDKYDIRIYSDTPGVYFTAGTVITGFTPAATNECTVGAGGAVGAPTLTPVNEAGTLNATYPGVTCSVPAANRVREIRTTGGDILGIDTYDALWINLPNMVYDTSIIGDGVEAVIRISFRKYPCGEIFTASHTVGTFVTTCPVGAGGTTLLYPFMPPLDGSIPGWWGGFLVVNGGTTAGTAVLTLVEEDGDSATFTTPSIAAGAMWNAGSMADFLTSVTPNAGNAGTFGDSNVSIVGVCAFNLGGGFAFTGNGDEGTGYTAYVLGAAGWQ